LTDLIILSIVLGKELDVPYYKVHVGSGAGWRYFRQVGAKFQEQQPDGSWMAGLYSDIEDVRFLGNIVLPIHKDDVPLL
jgi:hypothetical protein